MAKIQLDSGPSSSATHRLTQTSSVVNRHAMERPTNLAIEEAARAAQTAPRTTSAAPSRLVNLRVHAADLAAAETPAPQPEAPQHIQPIQPTMVTPIVPKIVEFGAPIDKAEVEQLANVIDFNQIVPDEAPVEEATPIASMSPAISTPTVATPAATTTNEYYSASSMQSPSPSEMSLATPATMTSQDLAMNIAADYAAASMGASLNTPMAEPMMITTPTNSIDTIAHAASEAIAAIRTATEPEEIAKQIASLQAFAETLRQDSSMPEMLELSNTIEKFVGVAMKSSAVQAELDKQQAVQIATKTAQTNSSAIKINSKPTPRPASKPQATPISVSRPAPIRRAAPTASRPQPIAKRHTAAKQSRPSLIDDEDQALRKVLRSVADIDDSPAAKSTKRTRRKGSGKRFALAVFCAAFCVAIVVYLVGSNIPDISVKVAAMQTGVEASYPTYIPRDYSLSDIDSEEGKLTLTFNGPDKSSFSITEEKSSWDSTTLLRNYVEPTWSDNYVTTHEQGITIYISGSNAAWVNGGVMYKITNTGNALTKKQLRNIVTSM